MEANNLDQRLSLLEQKIDTLTDIMMSQTSQNTKESYRDTQIQNEKIVEEPVQKPVEAQTDKKEIQEVVQEGRLESLLTFITDAKKGCVDSNFLTYLNAMEHKIFAENKKLDELEENLKRNYDKYLERNNLVKAETIETKESNQASESQQVLTRNEGVHGTFETSMKVENQNTPDGQNAPNTQNTSNAQNVSNVQRAWDQKRERELRKGRNQAVHAQKTPKMVSGAENTQKGKKLDLEFGIGGALLSVVGALFIIAAFVIFGMNYMGSLAQGVLLYALGGIVIVFSEFVIKKHLEKFSRPMTALGIGTLYTATILNYLYLHTINAAIAIVATFIIAIFSLLLSQKRESSILRVVGILGAYICFAPINSMTRSEDFIVPALISIIINVIYLYLPLQQGKAKTIVANVHACANMVFATSLVLVANKGEISNWLIMIFVGAVMIITSLIYRQVELGVASIVLSSLCIFIINDLFASAIYNQEYAIWGVILQAVFVAACFAINRKQKIRFAAIYCFSLTSILTLYDIGKTEYYIGIALILLFYKVFAKVKELRVANIVYSVIAAIIMITAIKDQIGFEYLILAVFLISVVTITYDKLFHVLMLVAVLQITAISAFEFTIALPLALALLLLCLAFFTYVELVPMRGNKVFGTSLLVWDVCLLLLLIALEQPIALTICLVCELAFLFIYFSKSSGYALSQLEKGRYLIYMIYLTYMVFVYRIEIPLVASIILMLLAIASVAVGFVFKQKMVRIYGLLLAFFVCFKLLLIDFKGQQSSDRVLLFFFVGILALAISYLYMRIERNLQREEENKKNDADKGMDQSMINMPQVPVDMDLQQPKEQFVVEQPMVEQSAWEQPVEELTMEEKSVSGQSAVEPPTVEQSFENQTVTDQEIPEQEEQKLEQHSQAEDSLE